MDNCLVCWEQNDNLVSSRIYLKLRVWKEYNVQQIIEKHLSWWHLRQTKQREPWICLQCWQELLSFHKFYERVENINHNLPQQKNLKNPSSIMNSSMRDSFDSDDDDGDFKSPKRRKIIKRDIDDDNNIEEFTIVDVRTDNNIFIPETVMEDPFDDGHVNDKGTQANLITLDITGINCSLDKLKRFFLKVIIYFFLEFKQDIKGLITTEIKSLRRGIQYDLNRLEEKLAPSMIALAPEDNSYAKKISEYKDLLDIHEPFNDLQTFCEFENKLRTDKECVDALVNIF